MSKASSTELIERGESSPSDIIRVAMTEKADLAQIEKLLELQERWEANQARKAYHKSMAEFKANPPKIFKDRKVGYDSKTGGKVNYNHASLGNIVEKISKELSKYGLSASWKTQQDKNITVTCKLTHVQGYGEETSLTADADMSGSKNNIQAIGSTITYLERYTLLALTGLATYEQDTDGVASQSSKPVVTAPAAKPSIEPPRNTDAKPQLDQAVELNKDLETLARKTFAKRQGYIDWVGREFNVEIPEKMTSEQKKQAFEKLNIMLASRT